MPPPMPLPPLLTLKSWAFSAMRPVAWPHPAARRASPATPASTPRRRLVTRRTASSEAPVGRASRVLWFMATKIRHLRAGAPGFRQEKGGECRQDGQVTHTARLTTDYSVLTE